MDQIGRLPCFFSKRRANIQRRVDIAALPYTSATKAVQPLGGSHNTYNALTEMVYKTMLLYTKAVHYEQLMRGSQSPSIWNGVVP